MNLIRFLLASVAVFAWAALIWANTDVPSNYPTIGKINKMDDRMDALIDPDAEIEVIASGLFGRKVLHGTSKDPISCSRISLGTW